MLLKLSISSKRRRLSNISIKNEGLPISLLKRRLSNISIKNKVLPISLKKEGLPISHKKECFSSCQYLQKEEGFPIYPYKMKSCQYLLYTENNIFKKKKAFQYIHKKWSLANISKKEGLPISLIKECFSSCQYLQKEEGFPIYL